MQAACATPGLAAGIRPHPCCVDVQGSSSYVISLPQGSCAGTKHGCSMTSRRRRSGSSLTSS